MCSTNQTDHEIEETGGAVVTRLYGNKNFTTPPPPVDQATVQGALTDFTLAVAASAQGGIHATNEKNKKRHELIVLLRKLGLYVQGNCNDDVAILTSSGFRAASRTRTLGPLPKPVIGGIDNGHTTQLLVTVQKIAQA